MNQQTIRRSRLLPTRQELQAYLRSRGIDPSQLKRMSSWDLVHLIREYQQVTNA